MVPLMIFKRNLTLSSVDIVINFLFQSICAAQVQWSRGVWQRTVASSLGPGGWVDRHLPVSNEGHKVSGEGCLCHSATTICSSYW